MRVYRNAPGRTHAHGMRLVQHPGLGAVMQPVMVPSVALAKVPGQYPGLPVPTQPYPQNLARADMLASLGASDMPALRAADDPAFKNFNKIPTQYVISITLGGVAGNNGPGSVSLRPEPFVLTRITWATTGDTYPYTQAEPGYSIQGRAVRMQWGDEFTKLFGTQSALVSAAMGDSNGFLDIVKGLLFQGAQTLNLTLNRLHWPSVETAADTQWDFVFSGLSLLPPGINQSGSAG